MSGGKTRRPHPSGSTRKPSTSTRNPATSARPHQPRERGYRPPWRLPLGGTLYRLRIAAVVICLAVIGFSVRLVQIQAIDQSAYAAKAAAQNHANFKIPAGRGAILDRNGVMLAGAEAAITINCDPTVVGIDVKNPDDKTHRGERTQRTAEMVAKHLGGVPGDYLDLLTRPDTRYVILKDNVPAATYRNLVGELKTAGFGGVYGARKSLRTYPSGRVAANVIGFIDNEGRGQSGLESIFQSQLAGKDGQVAADWTPFGLVPLTTGVQTDPVNGATVTTTIDADLQASVELALQKAVKPHGKQSAGWAIAMDIKTGEVLANAHYPTFDPAKVSEANEAGLGNRSASDALEPGSVQKVLTMAAMADLGIVSPSTQLTVPPAIESGGVMITDDQEHGTMRWNGRGIMANSSNIGLTMLGRKMTREQYFDYMRRFGLGQKTGIQVPGEAVGIVSPAMSDPQLDRAFFGQSLSLNAFQMTAALAGIANGGIYNPPTLVKSVKDAEGRQLYDDKREPRRVISAEASAKTLEMMEAVVMHGKNDLSIPGYRLGGKTGTAERFEPSCSCYRGNTVSYAAVGPLEDPRVVIYLAIDKPTGKPSGYYQAAPAVTELMRLALPRYGVPKSPTPAREESETW